MKKIIIAIVVLLVLCAGCCGGLYFLRGSIPFLKDIKLGTIGGINLDQNIGSTLDPLSGSIVPTKSNDESFNTNINDTNININVSDKTWPTDIPSVVKEFKYGTIKSVNKISNAETKFWSVTYENIVANAHDDYKRDLEMGGFTDLNDLNTIESSGSWTITGVQDKVTVIAGYSATDEIVTITISQEL